MSDTSRYLKKCRRLARVAAVFRDFSFSASPSTARSDWIVFPEFDPVFFCQTLICERHFFTSSFKARRRRGFCLFGQRGSFGVVNFAECHGSKQLGRMSELGLAIL